MTTSKHDAAMAQGYEALGKSVPVERMSVALATCRAMDPDIQTATAMSIIGRVAQEIERDQPYRALQAAQEHFDVMGSMRLYAVLLTGSFS